MLTRRGWSFVGAAAGLYLGGRLLGLVQLAVLAVATLLLLAGSYFWVRLHVPALSATRSLKERLQVGVDGRVDVLVRARRRTPTLAVADAFDRGRRTARFLLPPLARDEEARAAYRFPTDRRGRFEVGPLRAMVVDPFGLASATRRVLGTEQVLVYPRVYEIMPLPEVSGLDLDRDHPRVRARIEPAGEFMTLRDYSPGDDLRHVHWRSTARRGHLVVRQNEARRQAPVLLVLDVRPGAHTRQSFERAVEACASIATALHRAERPFEVRWTTGTPVGTPGRRYLATIMDELAVVEPHGPDRLLVAMTRHRVGACIAVTGTLETAEASGLGTLVRDGGTLVAVTTGNEQPSLAARTRRFRLVTLHDDPRRLFRDTWNEAVLLWQRNGTRRSSA